MPSSLCDRCLKPGACCHNFALPVGKLNKGTLKEVLHELKTIVHGGTPESISISFGYGQNIFEKIIQDAGVINVQIGFPFYPLRKNLRGYWQYGCTKLSKEGRCTIYEKRPQVCREFIPGRHKPCTHAIDAIGMCSERATGWQNMSTHYARNVSTAMQQGLSRLKPRLDKIRVT